MRVSLIMLLLLAPGCAQSWQTVDRDHTPTVAVSDLERLFDNDGKPSPRPFGVRIGPVSEGQWRSVRPETMTDMGIPEIEATPPAEAAAPVRPEPVIAERPAPRLPLPRRRSRAPREKPKGEPRDIEQLARDRFIANPTLVRAERITFFCPSRYRARVKLSGGLVESEPGGVRRATGGARLVCRELTFQADEIVLRPAKGDDVQILARGNAGIVSRLGKRIVREEGLRSLVINNDRTVPIR